MKKSKIHSYHTFILPFVFNKKDKHSIVKNYEKIEQNISYNQRAYFHKFFEDSMYDDKVELYIQSNYNDTTITIKKSQEYNLTLENVTLRLFDTNIGMLTFNIENRDYHDINSILEINDFTRRVYPEYLNHEEKISGLVPDYVKLKDVVENFEYDETLKEPKLSKIIEMFLPTKLITPAVDDRMFTISFYDNPEFANQLKINYEADDNWYKYLFIDGHGKNVQDMAMQKKLTQKATYSRWRDFGTMYGMSKYSFVCLADSKFPLEHMKTIYFDMFTLLLMIRATLLKFAKDISNIAKTLEDKETSKDVTHLYEEYIKFVNKYYFREITAKDQGLELYEQALNTLNIQRDIKDLDLEIEELFKYVEMKQRKISEEEAEKTNKKLNNITLYGGVLLGASVLTGFFGMNVGQGNFSSWVVYPAIILSIYFGYKKFKGDS